MKAQAGRSKSLTSVLTLEFEMAEGSLQALPDKRKDP